MADCAKTGENVRPRCRTTWARPIFDMCDLILREKNEKKIRFWVHYFHKSKI